MSSPLLVTAAIILEQGRVLLTQRPDDGRHAGFWEFPGGKIDPGESPEQALAREIEEELGVSVTVGRIYEVVYFRYKWGPVLILAYLCRITCGVIRNLEVAAHRWVEPAELSTFRILPADLPILKRLSTEKFTEV
jgi:8-oxo-dGTP diphosphatase